MDTRKTGVGFVFAASCLVVGTAMAQVRPYQDPPPVTPARAPVATQVKRCENLSLLLQQAALARDTHESEGHFLSKVSGRQRLSMGIRNLVHEVFSSDKTPDAWRKDTYDDCAQKVG